MNLPSADGGPEHMPHGIARLPNFTPSNTYRRILNQLSYQSASFITLTIGKSLKQQDFRDMLTRFICILPLILHLPLIPAFPSGPGSCNSPNPLGGPHGYSFQTNALSDAALEVRVDGKALNTGTTLDFSTGRSYIVELVATGTQFRGFLIKL